MNYDAPELRDLLAGHYVLGHMAPQVQARFERLMLSRTDYSKAVTTWEERLAPMYDMTAPQQPPPRVWRHLLHQIRREPPTPRRPARDHWFGAGIRAFAGATAAVLLIGLGLYLLRPSFMAPPPSPHQHYAVISTQQGATQWIVTLDRQTMNILAVGDVVPPAGKSYQLWMLLEGGSKPVSLGVLPVSGGRSQTLHDQALERLKSARRLAVSLEPQGGSPTGLPTGPVVYTAALTSL